MLPEHHQWCQCETIAKDEHVGNIKLTIQTIKEWFQAIWLALPHKWLPTWMIVEWGTFCIMWLKAFPLKVGVSPQFSAHSIIMGTNLNYSMHCCLLFGAYVKAHDDPLQKPRDHLCICLGSVGIFQGNYKFFNLNTGCVVKQKQWHELPANDPLIRCIEALAHCD